MFGLFGVKLKKQSVELIMHIMTSQQTVNFPSSEAQKFVEDYLDWIKKYKTELGDAAGDLWLATCLLGVCRLHVLTKKTGHIDELRQQDTCLLSDLIALKCGAVLCTATSAGSETEKIFEDAMEEFLKEQAERDIVMNALADHHPALKDFLKS